MIFAGPCPNSSASENTSDFGRSVLTASQDRFSQRKVSLNAVSTSAGNGNKNTNENRGRKGTAVTTSHLLFALQRGKIAVLLPISQPKSDFVRSEFMQKRPTRGAGVSGTQGRKYRTEKLARNFMPNGPCPLLAGSKKRLAQRPATHRRVAAVNAFQ